MSQTTKDMRGFTLIETLVAITILTTMMVAPFYAIEQSITAADASRDELIGSSLAQEGVEYVRSMRDDNYLYARANTGSTISWLYGLNGTDTNGNPDSSYTNCFTPDYQCSIDPTASSGQIQQYASSATIPVLYLNPSYLYTQSSTNENTPTVFTRSLQLTTVSNTEVKVVVTVKWKTRNIPYVTTITEYLDNWLP
jgi:prepilin-type N-terminal cleavage/methylation domain-containing protein